MICSLLARLKIFDWERDLGVHRRWRLAASASIQEAVVLLS
jgi:hypothetical protein